MFPVILSFDRERMRYGFEGLVFTLQMNEAHPKCRILKLKVRTNHPSEVDARKCRAVRAMPDPAYSYAFHLFFSSKHLLNQLGPAL